MMSLQAQPAEVTPALLRTQSPAGFVHRLNLYSADGQVIDPKDAAAKPYAPSVTCGKCHPYAVINSGWHFNAATNLDVARAPHGRPGQPWIYIDPKTGAQTPVSYRGWPGTKKPAEAGLSDWDFVMTFARQMPGGGVGDAQTTTSAAESKARWQLAGHFENDCMACHSATMEHDQAERARQVAAQNLAWISTVALGLAEEKGSVKSLPENFDPENTDPNQTATMPALTYDAAKFDANNRVFFNIVRKPAAERCTYCHATRVVAPREEPIWRHDGDVHLRAGMNCSDCHRHGLDHAMVRGYEGEARVTGNAEAASLSCRGCHYGSETAPFEKGPQRPGGRLGAPYPLHRGLPLLHLDKMTCTACHSGPAITSGTTTTLRIQTAMAHGLGLSARGWKTNAAPPIAAPVFVRNEQGKIEPRAMFWPLETSETQKAAPQPVSWPIGHDVRPASQALGAGGCIDCHSARSYISHAAVIPPFASSPKRLTGMRSYWNKGEPGAEGAFELAFALRPTAKLIMFTLCGLIAIVLAAVSLRGIALILERQTETKD